MRPAALLAAAAAAALLAACSTDGRSLRAPSPDQTLSIVTTSTTVAFEPAPDDTEVVETETPTTTAAPVQALELTLPFDDGARIPDQHSCKGANVSPAVSWANVPETAQELAIVVTDLDSDPPGFTQWAVTGIDPGGAGLPEGDLAGAVEQLNDAGGRGWGGPCIESGEHRYAFTLYALDSPTGLPELTKVPDVMAAIDSRIVASIAVTATWSPEPPETTGTTGTPESTVTTAATGAAETTTSAPA